MDLSFNTAKHIYRMDDYTRNPALFKDSDIRKATLINENLGKMTIEEQRVLLNSLLSDYEVTQLLLTYEFNSYHPTKPVPSKKLASTSLTLANRYTWKAGGKQLESPQWRLVNQKNSPQEMEEGEFWLTNTYSPDNESEVSPFVDRLVEIFRHLNTNYRVQMTTQFYKRDDITMVIIRFCPKKKGTNVTVGL